MAPPRRYWVKISVNKEFLSKLPHFPTPVSKTRLKKLAAEEKKNGATSTGNSSPTESDQGGEKGGSTTAASATQLSQFKINSGLKESSTSGLTMNSINSGLYTLDKSGSPCKKWVKKPKSFKTFSGFKVKYVSYVHKDEVMKEINDIKQENEIKQESEMKEENVQLTQVKEEGDATPDLIPGTPS